MSHAPSGARTRHERGPRGPLPSIGQIGYDEAVSDDREALVDLPPTEVIREGLAACQEALEVLSATSRQPPPQLVNDQRHFASMLELAYQRDRQVADRQQLGEAYEGCWCLGLGGRRRVGLALRTAGCGVLSAHQTAFAETCGCPDGLEHERLKREQLHDLEVLAQAKLTARLLNEAQVPQRYQAATLDTWHEAQAAAGGGTTEIFSVASTIGRFWRNVEHNERYAAAEPCLLLMVGDHGEGKTSCAVACVRRQLERGEGALLWTVQEFLDELRSGFGTPEAHKTLLAVKRCPFLVLDDLGAEALSDQVAVWAVPVLLEVLSHRQEHCLPTIVTTNLRPAELSRRLGGRLAERVLTTEMSLVASFVGLANLRGGRW